MCCAQPTWSDSLRADASHTQSLGWGPTAALGANSTLQVLDLSHNNFGAAPDATGAGTPLTVLLSSLVAHPSLRELRIIGSSAATPPRAALGVGACLHALLAANTLALKVLDVRCSGLRAEGLRLLFRALPHNTHLQTLSCGHNAVGAGDIDEAFARDVLLPAVRANASLTRLKCSELRAPHLVQGDTGSPLLLSCEEAMRLVDRRPVWQ